MPALETSHAQRVLSSLNQQRAAGRFCDALLNLGDGVLYMAHRNVLACFSDLFQVSVSNSSQPAEFSLQGCPSDGLDLLLNFVYTGELKLEVNNLQKVQEAAASLCVPEALNLCQQFQVNSGGPVTLKRRRGRPKKCQTDTVKEENPLMVLTEESSFDASAAGFTILDDAAAPTSSTTTRSGRVVKGPKRLVTADASPTSDSKTALSPVVNEMYADAAEHLKSNPSAAESEVTELKCDTKDCSESQATGKTTAEVEEGDDEPEGFGDDTDEEYLPPAESSSTAPPASTGQSKTPNCKNKDDVEAGGSNKGSAQCPVCLKFFKSKYYLKVHNRRHTGEKPFGCSKCGKMYFRKESLSVHESRGCSRMLTYSCCTCSLTFNTKEELREHVITTSEMPHKCSICNERFMHKKNLTTHLMRVHGHPKPHACPQCPKTFLTRTELRVHEAAKHRGEKPFVCEECGHRASSRNGLQMHIKAIHRNERPFVCNICGHAFSQKNNLNMHLRVHSGERPYQCHLCGKTFRTQPSLDKHHRTHTGERPFSCDVCEQRFTEKGALLRHKASKHEEGRPHCCYICNKTFKAMEQLRVHLHRHKGMRKFECTKCGYKFTRQAHLRRHVQIHKRTENYNPRQRKLRNVIVKEVDGSLSDSEATNRTEAPIAESAADPTVGSDDTDSTSGLGSDCINRAVDESQEAAAEEETSSQERERSDAVESITEPEEPPQTQPISDTFESTMDVEE
ncbi:telomere zinc finger-associated protein [Cyprinodon tularosa]|uniref:telomere zinc finger-associated protein n=1 Tax=Cyprinodon tularosa TaxID=77115 RepID=UPI0018E26EA8|nr:telomere zinc finger-associated protein [Cyprinodon tularosa]XP_038165090.1 telomere zinc finger-associated protein [Cyprinodon tularosa]